MMGKRNKALVSIMCLSVAGGLLAGCSGSGNEASPAPQESAGAATATTANGNVYPLQLNKKLTYWAEMNPNVSSTKPTFDQVPFFQELQKRTGVQLQFTQPPANQTKEALNMLLASGDLPDIIEYPWATFPGGGAKAISDGYILKLNDAIDKYAPNFKKYLKEHPEVDKQIKTDDGSYYVFPFIRGDDLLKTYQGPIIRQDWLDELGLPVPATIDEWYTVLKAFKEKKGIAAPLTFLGTPSTLFGLDGGAFIGAYGVKKDFYQVDGVVKYGPLEPGYKEFLGTFRKWYEEGLIDKNIATMDTKNMDSNMTSDRSGASVWNSGAGINKWSAVLKQKNANAKLVGAPYPVLKKGDKPMFGQKDASFVTAGGSVAISAKSKNVEAAVRLLDYGYSEEGHNLYNFGVEGVSYKLVNQVPTFTDFVMNNPDKLAVAQALSLYARSAYSGPFVQDKQYAMQVTTMQEQKDAIQVWSQTDTDKYVLPTLSMTPEESAEYAAIMNDVNTLVDEMSLKIILGAVPLDSYEGYVTKLKGLKVDRAIALKKAALERYNKR